MGILEASGRLALERLSGDAASLTVERAVVGLFFTGVKLSNGVGGVCYTPVKDIPTAVCCPTSAGRIFDPVGVAGTPVGEILPALGSEEPIKTAVAIATLNALSATCWNAGLTGESEIEIGIDAQDRVRMPAGSSVAVVGALVPTLRALKQRGGTWWVIEQDPRTLKPDEMEHYVPADRGTRVLGEADVLVVTGVTLINHTLEGILDAARPGAEIAVMGPTVSCLPEPLFEKGVTLTGGVWVRKPDELLGVLAAGGSGYHFFDKTADRIVIRHAD
jgi:uncharacterized protein (DUF4213/DUF364 family)